MNNRNTIVFILAAGLGSRLEYLTENSPKALVEYNGEPILKSLLLKIKEEGFSDVIINIHHFAKKIVDYLKINNNFGLEIFISDESEKLLDIGGALLKALPIYRIYDSVLVYNVDILSDINLKSFCLTFDKLGVDALLAVRDRETERKLLFTADTLLLRSWFNLKTKEYKGQELNYEYKEFAFCGIHIIKVSLIECFADVYDKNEAFSIIDAYLKFARDKDIKAFVDKAGIWKDLGKLREYKQ